MTQMMVILKTIFVFGTAMLLSLATNASATDSASSSTSPYIGVSYYPEVAGDQVDADIAKMKSIGVNLVRFGEFAWSRMETNERSYNFGWLHQAVDKFAQAGIGVVLCTPTAAPPIWLTEAHPDVLRVMASGQSMGHGGRRQYCPNSETFRRYATQIAERMGVDFGSQPGIIAWQIDNEFWGDCYCTNCERAFHVWLKNHFGTIDHLNAAWLTVLWSQEYQSFDQVPLPNPSRASHHPSLWAAYRRFMSDSYISFCNEQAAALRRHTKKPITTNAHNPVAQEIDQAKLFRDLDIIGTDSYAEPGDLLRYAFECAWMRSLNKPFWLAETASTHSAGTAVGDASHFEHLPGALRAKMWLTYALGGEAVSFWLWRAHWAGQELEHGSLIYPWGDECINTAEINRVSEELSLHAEWLRSTKPKPAAVALEYGLPMQWQFEATPIASGFRYDGAISAYYRQLVNQGIACDIVMPSAGLKLDGYKVVCSPYAPTFDSDSLSRLKHFVEAGGTWVLGPLSACRTEEATAHRDACYGADVEKWLGIHVRHRLTPGGVTKLIADKQTIGCRWWCDAYETDASHAVLAKYSGGPLDGFAAIVECPIGQGRVIVFGTQPDEAWLGSFLKQLAPKSEISADAGIVVAERVTADGKPDGCIAVNTGANPAQYQLHNGEKHKLEAYGVDILPGKK